MLIAIFIAIIYYWISNESLMAQDLGSITKTELEQQLNNNEREGLLRQYKWLRCIVMRQMAYSATSYQTKAVAYLLTERQSITLDSWMCLLSHQIANVKVQWKFIAVDGAALTFLAEKGDKYFVHGNSMNLEITSVRKEDTGFYFINVNGYDNAAYFLEVLKVDEIHSVSHLSYNSKYIPPSHILEDNNLFVSLRLTEWTPCSRCDHIGVRHRSGTCFVEAYKENEPIKPVHYPAFELFLGGIPCQSGFLSKHIKDLKEVKSTQSIYMKSFCRVPCPTRPVEEKEKKWWKDIKGAKRRFFDILKPTFTNIIGRKTIFQQKNTGTIMSCPRSKSSSIPIIWKHDQKLMTPEALQRFTKGRIIIDHTGRIRIRQLRLDDSGEYSCWQGNILTGTVELIVQDRFVIPEYAEALLPLLSYLFVLLATLFFGCKLVINYKIKSTAT